MTKDTYYFRVKRDNKWQNVYFSDMTEEEINEYIKDKPTEWWKALAIGLKEVINDMEDDFYDDDTDVGIKSMGYF